MSQDSKLSVHDNIWHFSVTDPQLHKRGHTVYKVVCKSFPIKSPETLTEVTCWKRYNDFKTLYKALAALHKALHRKDQFPEFAKPKLFGRFDETVIEERRLSAVNLLNFVTTQPHLYKSLVFKQFIEDGNTEANFNKTYPVMTPNPPNLDILSGGSHSDGNPPPDLVPQPGVDRARKTSSEFVDDVTEQQHAATTSLEHTVSSNSITDLVALEGTWNFPQVADNISLDSSAGDEVVNTDDDSVAASSLPDTDLSFFDPVSQDSPVVSAGEQEGSIPRSNSWLLAGLDMCARIDEGNGSTAERSESERSDTFRSTDSTLTYVSNISDTTLEKMSLDQDYGSGTVAEWSMGAEEFDPLRSMSMSSDSSKVECGKGDLDLSTELGAKSDISVAHSSSGSFRIQSTGSDHLKQNVNVATTGSRRSEPSSRSQSVGSEKSQDSEKPRSNSSTPSRSAHSLFRKLMPKSPGSHKPRAMTDQSVSTMDLGGKEDYIYLAANQICMAQNSEANGDFEVAFAYYKSGVGILLQGVQGDTNKGRRDAVRRKTAQYLMKAEDLFNRHLATEHVDERRWGANSYLSPSLDLDPSFAFIRGSMKELRRFQVLGTVDKVILVRDKDTDETYVIKSIPKSAPDMSRTPSILPTSCPHMVSLHKFYETDNAVFLLLQYASGGKLWTYIGDYLNSDRATQAVGPSDVPQLQMDSRNIYSGTKAEDGEHHTENNTTKESQNKIAMKSVSKDRIDASEGVSNSDGENSQGKVGNISCVLPQNKHRADDAGVVRFSSLGEDNNSSAVKTDRFNLGAQSVQAGVQEDPGLLVMSCHRDNHTAEKETLSRRYSSLSDDCSQIHEGDSSVISPSTLLEEDQFQLILEQHRTNLEGFSINSIESEDFHRHNSSFTEKIDSIPEVAEFNINSPKHVASRQISADEVFSFTRKEASVCSQMGKVKHASTDGIFPSSDVKHFAASFKSDDIVQNSKDLLKQVDRVLQETDNRGTEIDTDNKASSSSEENTATCSIAKQSSQTSNDSLEEPSIYDRNRSSDDDSSDHISNDNHDRNIDLISALYEKAKIISSQGATSCAAASSATENENKVKPQQNSCSSIFRQLKTPHKLSISRMDSKDMTRSASFECDLKSPVRNRARTVSDLFDRLDSSSVEQVRIPEISIKKWTSQLVTAVSRLHSLGLVCRDLKPSNILLGDGGHVFLTYFCHLGHGDQELDWEAVDKLYAAPEIGSISSFDNTCDWWSIGALLYELIVGRTLSECHPGGINSHTCLHVPTFVSNEARSLLEGLLTFNPRERLGSGMAGAEEIKAHPFFHGVDWHVLEYS